MEKNTMKDLPLQERPYELCITEGPEKLTDAQLLAVIIRTGSRNANALELASEKLRRFRCSVSGNCPGESGRRESLPD